MFKVLFFMCFDICVVPPNPVTLQNRSYNGTAAKDKPSIKKTIRNAHFRELLFFFDKLEDIYAVTSILKIVIKKKRTTINIIIPKIAKFFDFLFS